MTLELGPGLAAFLGTFLTTIAGIAALWIAQRNEFKKAADASVSVAQDLKAQSETTAAALKEKTEATAADIKAVVIEQGDKSTTATTEIHGLVNSRLTEALTEIANLKQSVLRLTTEKAVITGKVDEEAKGKTDDVREKQ